MLTKEEMPACPVATTVALIGSKWKLLIMRNLLIRPWRFNELKKSLDGISQKVLTDSLRSMEEDGLVIRTVYPEVPPRVEYSLSELGETMRPILDAMAEWGTAYKKATHLKILKYSATVKKAIKKAINQHWKLLLLLYSLIIFTPSGQIPHLYRLHNEFPLPDALYLYCNQFQKFCNHS